MNSFNLIYEPCIPVTFANGKVTRVGLQELLIQAHKIENVCHDSPLVVTSVYRLALALIFRIFPLENYEEWGNLWQKKNFDAVKIEEYFSQWKTRFNLFDDQFPFYQTPGLPENEKKTINNLILHKAAGSSVTFFDHSTDDQLANLTPEDAFLYLLTNQTYALSGGRGYSPSRLNNGVACYLTGGNLFETLVLNHLIKPLITLRIPSKRNDIPRWERDSKSFSDIRQDVIGYLDYLTFLFRRAYILPPREKENELVCEMVYLAGSKLPDAVLDPFIKYVQDKNMGWKRIYIATEKQLWRDYHTLISLNPEKDTRPPLNLEQLAELKNNSILAEEFTCSLYCGGLLSDKASIKLWSFTHLPLPTQLLKNQDLVNTIKKAMDFAEAQKARLNGHTYRAAQHLLSGRENNGDKNAINNLVDTISTEPLFWAMLESPFKTFIISPSLGDEEGEQAVTDWESECKLAFTKCWQITQNSIINSTRGPEAIARAYNYKEKV
ncbi:MAG: type I-E CRISPR-associated protein Cse1/CasA [Ignavibacteria bacterium]|nr:type I-E CRISPR-associated protein Cse1/CasA [Ignavibacteria bacterium]